MEKYEHLKNVTMIRIQSANSVQQLFQKKLTQAYKSLCNHALTVITSFESEIESEM